jgi:hypothetical protein
MRHSGQAKKLTYFMLALALFVFLFALHAKVSLYQPAGHGGEASKLWVDSQKMDVLSAIENAGTAFVSLLAAVTFLFAPLCRGPRPIALAHHAPIPFLMSSFQPSRFLRPPPAA